VILVAGGSGTLGSQLVRQLLASGHGVRILTRDADRVGDHDGAELVVGDVRNPADVRRAVAGAGTVVSAVQGLAGPGGVSPASIDRTGNVHLIDAAAEAGADVVLMSVIGASQESPMELFRMKAAAERHLRASAVAWTVVRSSAFLETWTTILEKTAGRSGRPMVFGRGDNPVNFVAASDVATVLANAVTDPTTRGRIIEVSGPVDLTLDEIAGEVMRAAGRPGAPRHLPRGAMKVVAATVGRARPQVGRMVRASLIMDTVDLRRSIPEQASTEVTHIVGSTTAATVLARTQDPLRSS
jgi:NADH dehydrogenase